MPCPDGIGGIIPDGFTQCFDNHLYACQNGLWTDKHEACGYEPLLVAVGALVWGNLIFNIWVKK